MTDEEKNTSVPDEELEDIKNMISDSAPYDAKSTEPEEDTEEPQSESVRKSAKAEEEPKKGGIALELYTWAQEIVACIIFVVLLFIFIVRVVGVEGSSMFPTLEEFDKVLLLSNFLYEPERGDIVVLTKESFSDQPLVKRIIATEGQTIDIDFNTGEVWVDGVLQDEPYINEQTHRSGDIEFPAVVPEGCIFVMGDNRNASSDSRFSIIGMIDERCVLGKVLVVVFPFDRIGTVK